MEEKISTKVLSLQPVVFAVGSEYQIMLYTAETILMWVQVGEKCYYDDANGVLRSNSCVHRCIVPQGELDRERAYTVCARPVLNRKSYYSEVGEVVQQTFDFRPVSGDSCRAYHIADSHRMLQEAVKAAQIFGETDFLILNGDISSECDTLDSCRHLYELAWQTARGRIPVVYARGNHEMRGPFAENFVEQIPTREGKTYYTFRLGNIWGMILDCGEDKADESIEYGGTICCHAFRQRETDFIHSVIAREREEYGAAGVTHKIVVVHTPFTVKEKSVFDIEDQIYKEWAELLVTRIRPDVVMAGHLHQLRIDVPGDENLYREVGCPVVIGGKCDYKDYYGGAGYVFGKEGITVAFTDSNGDMRKVE